MTGILVRRNNTKEVRILNDRWWDVLIQHSNRDQLSFNFILWKYFKMTEGLFWHI